MTYLRNSYGTKITPQSEPIPGSTQIANNAGGYAWNLDEWKRLDRFLILGSEGGTYYIGERELTNENVSAVTACIKADGIRVVNRVVEISEGGRAPKNDPALFVLAMCAGIGDTNTRKQAFLSLPRVARIGTHLLHFAAYVKSFRGWGRGLRTAIGQWFNQPIGDIVFQTIKYQARDGWSMSDLLRLSHPKPSTTDHSTLYKWIVDGEFKVEATDGLKQLEGFIKMQDVKSDTEAAKFITDYRLPMECVPTQFKTSPIVWEALFPHLGLTALIRNLGNMTKSGFIGKGKFDVTSKITERLNQDAIHKARVHPVAILAALCTYKQGHGIRGKGEWDVVSDIVDALDSAFYLAFDNVLPTGKRIVLALDVSGSMASGKIAGVAGLTPRVGAAAMAMVTYKTEKQVAVISFQDRIVPLDISRHKRLDDVVAATNNLPFGRTDCAQPMLWARDNKIQADAFVIYTDSDTWFGQIHPSQALEQYRREFNIPSKMIIVGMTSNEFTIAPPEDGGCLDVVGFDTATPNVIADFIGETLAEPEVTATPDATKLNHKGD